MSIYDQKPWLNMYDDGVPENVDFTDETLLDIYEDTCTRYADRVGFVSLGYEMTFGEIRDQAYRLATCLADMGVEKGDKVAIHLPNVLHLVISYYAIMKIGAQAVMNNPLYTPPELEHQFSDSEAKIVITVDFFGNTILDVRPGTQVKQVICICLKDYLPEGADTSAILTAPPRQEADVYFWKDLMAKYEPTPPEVKVGLEDVCQLQYTGGTTGVSKGAMLTHKNLAVQLFQVDAWYTDLTRGEGSVQIGAIPFFHVYGLTAVMNVGFYYARKTVLVGKPQPDNLIQTIQTYRPRTACLVPTMYIGILNHPDFTNLDLSFVENLMSGSAPLPVEVINAYKEKAGVVINEGFGLTEASPVTHSNPVKKKQKVGSIGVPYPSTEVRLVDVENGLTEVAVGEPGEMIIKGPQVMKGYWNRPEETDITLRDGWLFTGDIATMDEEGFFYIVDRKKDLIISGGYNIYPREIDEALYRHPKVLEASCIGVPHEKRGEQIKAFVVLKEGETATEQEIIDFCATRLAKYKLPTMVEFRTELPKSNVGKILRKALRAEENKAG